MSEVQVEDRREDKEEDTRQSRGPRRAGKAYTGIRTKEAVVWEKESRVVEIKETGAHVWVQLTITLPPSLSPLLPLEPLRFPDTGADSRLLALFTLQVCNTPFLCRPGEIPRLLWSHHSATFTDQHSLNNQPSEKSLDIIPSLYQEHVESINHGTLHWIFGYMSFCYWVIIFFRMITVSNNSLYCQIFTAVSNM